jgi:hypothetical protein
MIENNQHTSTEDKTLQEEEEGFVKTAAYNFSK